MKKQYTFTLNENLVSWLRKYAEDEDRSMSSLINSYILKLKRTTDNEPTGNILKVD